MGPIDYTSQFQQPNLTQSIASGYQLGAGIRQDLQQQQQAQLAQQQAAQYQADVQAAMASPTPQNFSTLALKYPQQREAIKQSWDQLSEGERKEEGDVMAQSYSALLSNRPDIAKTVLQKQIDARKNAGADASQYENALAMVDSEPQQALAALGFTLSHIGDPKAFAAQYAALGKEQREQAKAPAELQQATAEAEQKNAAVVGSKLGALAQAKTLKPGQVETAFKSMAAQGLIPKDQLPAYLSSIPENQEDLRAFLNVFKTAGLKPDEQMKYTDVDANTAASNATSRANNAASNAVAMRGQDLVNQRAIESNAAKNSAEGMLTPETVKVMAEQYRSGDTSVMQNLGRGAQGAKNIIAIREEVARQNADAGGTGADLAAKNAEFMGTKAAQRTAGTRIANVELAAREAMNLIPLARSASDEVARSGFLPFGKAGIMFDNQTNNPALRKFATANNGVVNTYARAISPSGVSTVADKEHAREMLSTAMDQKSYNAVLDQMQEEMKAALEAPQHVRQAINDSVTGRNTSGAHAPATNAPAVGTVMQGYRFKGGNPADKSNWVKQ